MEQRGQFRARERRERVPVGRGRPADKDAAVGVPPPSPIRGGAAMSDPVTIEYWPAWRSPRWKFDDPSREAWVVTCADHPSLGRDSEGDPWGYAREWRAKGVATRHRNAYHRH